MDTLPPLIMEVYFYYITIHPIMMLLDETAPSCIPSQKKSTPVLVGG
jgi:hypothetical protein